MPPRLSRFLVGLIAGLLVGLGYAWLIQPVTYYDTAPDSLRQDFRTDYVLMAAQSYQADGDLRTAIVRLAALGPQDPARIVEQASAYAEANDFAAADREALRQLADDLGALSSEPGLAPP